MPKRTKKPAGPTNEEIIAGLFKPEEIERDIEKFKTLEGQWVVLKPLLLAEPHRTRNKLLWKATGGFGCNPEGRGGALYGECFEDGERSRWEGPSLDVYGVFVGQLPKDKRTFLVRIERKTVEYRDVEVSAVTQVEAAKIALEDCLAPTAQFSQPDTSYSVDSIQLQTVPPSIPGE